MNNHQLHSTDISRDDFEQKNDPDFTRQFWRGFNTAVAVGFMLSIGAIAIGVHFGDEIDAFLKTKTGFWTLVGVIVVSGVSWFVGYIKKMME